MRTRKNLVLVLAATATCSALMVPAAAFASHTGGRDDVVQVGQSGSQGSGRSGGSDDVVGHDDAVGHDDGAGHDAMDDSASGTRTDDDGADASRSTGDGAEDEADEDGVPAAAAPTTPAPADHVKARLVAFDTMGVTWRAGRGGTAVVQYVVRLVPASGSTLSTTVDGDARSAQVAGLAASTRYRVSVTSVAADGTDAAAKAAGRTTTQSPEVAAKATRRDAERAAKDAERTQKAAAKAQRRLERLSGDGRLAAKAAAKKARRDAHEARTEAKHAAKEASRAERRARAHREDD